MAGEQSVLTDEGGWRMTLGEVLDAAAAAVAERDGCTEREAFGKLATACMRRGGYEVAWAPEAPR